MVFGRFVVEEDVERHHSGKAVGSLGTLAIDKALEFFNVDDVGLLDDKDEFFRVLSGPGRTDGESSGLTERARASGEHVGTAIKNRLVVAKGGGVHLLKLVEDEAELLVGKFGSDLDIVVINVFGGESSDREEVGTDSNGTASLAHTRAGGEFRSFDGVRHCLRTGAEWVGGVGE